MCLSEDIVTECLQFMIIEKKKQEQVYLMPPSFWILVNHERRCNFIIQPDIKILRALGPSFLYAVFDAETESVKNFAPSLSVPKISIKR